MPWDNFHLAGKDEEPVADGLYEFAGVAPGEVGASYGAGEEGVSGY